MNSVHSEKRLLLSDTGNMQQQLMSLQQEMQEMRTKFSQYETTISLLDAKVKTLSGHLTDITKGSGSVYTRWGRKTCPDNATLLYSGFTAGPAYTSTGSSGTNLCLPPDPLWSNPEPSSSRGVSLLYGTEYEFNLFSNHLVNDDMPCAMCMSKPGSEILMIPGRNR